MKLGDSIQILTVIRTEVDGDVSETTSKVNLGTGKCIILPNNAASQQMGEDGKTFSTSYTVVMKKPKDSLPKEGDVAYLTKSDKSIDDKECRITGLVTMKNWLKLWLQ